MQEKSNPPSSTQAHPEGQNQSLNILLVSDIHIGFVQLEELKAWHIKHPQKFDYVFALGDFDNLRTVPGEARNEKNSDCINITKVLTWLEYFSAPIIYIPGNHDPVALFHDNPKLTNQFILVQNSSTLIGDKLQVIGFGGSNPGFFEKDMNFELNPDSYPYDNEEEMAKDLNTLLEKHCNEDVQTILLTHTGPFYSSTTMIYREKEDRNLWLGLKELDKALRKPKFNILADLHGHSHPSIGRATIGKVQIINPGSMFDRNFGIMSLERLRTSNRWMVKKTEFIDLRAFS